VEVIQPLAVTTVFATWKTVWLRAVLVSWESKSSSLCGYGEERREEEEGRKALAEAIIKAL
jgi:hypothetical protein